MSKYLLDAPRCQHVKDDGIRCGSPALRGQAFCYNHDLMHHPRHRIGEPGFQLPVLESQKSIERAMHQVLQGYLDHKLTDTQARTVIYGISILAPWSCRNRDPYARDVTIDLPPAMRTESAPAIPLGADMESSEAGVEPGAVDTPARETPEPAINPTPTQNAETPPSIDNSQSPIFNLSDNSIVTAGPQSSIQPADAPHSKDNSQSPIANSYWLQHLPPEVANLRAPSGELIYEPPDWLPLTPEQLAYLRNHLPPDGQPGTAEEQANFRRLQLHFTHGYVKPPYPDEIRKLHAEAWADQDAWTRINEIVKKAPKSSARALMKALQP